MVALDYLGAEAADVVLRNAAQVEPPPCDAYNATARSSYRWGNPCTSYNNVCALPNIVGQLWSRRVVYELVVAHEARKGMVFDSILFLRPDLTAVVPLPPLCSTAWRHDWRSSSIGYKDWIVWVPRHLAANAFLVPSEAFASCRLIFGEVVRTPLQQLPLASHQGHVVYKSFSPEQFLINASALFGATLARVEETKPHIEPLIATFAIVRPRGDGMPMGLLCKYLSQGLDSAFAETHPPSQLLLAAKGVTLPQILPMGYRNSRADFHQSGPSCWRLLIANPYNSPA